MGVDGAGAVLYLAAPVGLRGALTWWAATALMLDWHLGMFETEDGRPRNLGAADALTLARAWLVPVALDTPTPLVCVAAAATDALDGPAARRAGPTRAGRDLEGLVDACFTAAALRGARRHGWLGRARWRASSPASAQASPTRVGVWFGRAHRRPGAAPRRALVDGAPGRRPPTAGRGRPRLADALLLAGSALSLGLLGRAVAASSRAASPSRASSPASGSRS